MAPVLMGMRRWPTIVAHLQMMILFAAFVHSKCHQLVGFCPEGNQQMKSQKASERIIHKNYQKLP
jgi:hypothetical protein